MTITSQQKKFALPLAAFVFSLTAYVITLGGWFCFLMVPPMTASVMIFLHYNWDLMAKRITRWLDRDGWH